MHKQALIEKQFVREIRAIPDEYLPNLLEIVRLYRDSVELKPAEESFREGWRDALSGETIPVSELWEGMMLKEPTRRVAGRTQFWTPGSALENMSVVEELRSRAA